MQNLRVELGLQPINYRLADLIKFNLLDMKVESSLKALHQNIYLNGQIYKSLPNKK